jgi:hypothetical protein
MAKKNAWLKLNSISPKMASGTTRKRPNPSSKSAHHFHIKLINSKNWQTIWKKIKSCWIWQLMNRMKKPLLKSHRKLAAWIRESQPYLWS